MGREERGIIVLNLHESRTVHVGFLMQRMGGNVGHDRYTDLRPITLHSPLQDSLSHSQGIYLD